VSLWALSSCAALAVKFQIARSIQTVEGKLMASRVQNYRQDVSPNTGFILSLLWVIFSLTIAFFTTFLMLPAEGWLVPILTLWGMALSSVVSALLYWRKRADLGVWIIIFSLWIGVLVLVQVTSGLGLVLVSMPLLWLLLPRRFYLSAINK
jgi:hypothetical protein